MALFPYCRRPSVCYCGNQKLLVVLCGFITGLIYFLWGRRNVPLPVPSIPLRSAAEQKGSGSGETDFPVMTPWGVPLVWGNSKPAALRRERLTNLDARTGLVVLAVGNYNVFVHRLLSSAEIYFLVDCYVTYYVLTDRTQELDPPPKLASDRELRVIPVSEVPGWNRLGLRRMALLSGLIKEQINLEMDYVYCIDADQVFTNPVGTEILGKLTATLHPEFYGKPRRTYPYEVNPDSQAYVAGGEGDFYYTSEFYGGLCARVLAMTHACSLLILHDQDRGVRAEMLEESYLNRYLIQHRPTCVLSPEYSWWDSPQVPEVPVHRLHSIRRQCSSTGSFEGNSDLC